MITGNKGEWSEIYALFKLIGDKQLLLALPNVTTFGKFNTLYVIAVMFLFKSFVKFPLAS